jgi:hypothetical protein
MSKTLKKLMCLMLSVLLVVTPVLAADAVEDTAADATQTPASNYTIVLQSTTDESKLMEVVATPDEELPDTYYGIFDDIVGDTYNVFVYYLNAEAGNTTLCKATQWTSEAGQGEKDTIRVDYFVATEETQVTVTAIHNPEQEGRYYLITTYEETETKAWLYYDEEWDHYYMGYYLTAGDYSYEIFDENDNAIAKETVSFASDDDYALKQIYISFDANTQTMTLEEIELPSGINANTLIRIYITDEDENETVWDYMPIIDLDEFITGYTQQLDPGKYTVTAYIYYDVAEDGKLIYMDDLTEELEIPAGGDDDLNMVTVTYGEDELTLTVRTYTDVKKDYWGRSAIAYVMSQGLFNGTTETTFEPETYMTRQMFMTVLARFAGEDTSEDPYGKAMAWAVENGVSDGSEPTASITREQMVTMLYRYLGEPETSLEELDFTDADQVSDYAKDALLWAVEIGVIHGEGDGILNPQGTATRAEVATMLANFMTNSLG